MARQIADHTTPGRRC